MDNFNSLLDDDNITDNEKDFSPNTLLLYGHTSRWAKIFSISLLSVLGAGLSILIGIMIIVPLQGRIIKFLIGFSVVLAILIWVASILLSYANSLQEFLTSKDIERLEYALERKKLFFILTCAIVLITILFSFYQISFLV